MPAASVDPSIQCPKCGHAFEIAAALTASMRQELEKEYAQKNEKEKSAIQARAAEEARRALALELESRDETLRARDKQIFEARDRELELRKKQRELEDAKRDFELEIVRRVDSERATVEEQVAKKAAEEHRLKDLEKDKKLTDLTAQIEDLKRRATQGSMREQGEVMELDVEQELMKTFETDVIEPVKTGARGADLLERVARERGKVCGTVIIEVKNAKAWATTWIEKIKEDQKIAGAEIAVIVSTTLPKGIERFGQVEGVWVCDRSSTLPVIALLREGLIRESSAKAMASGRDEKMGRLYAYFSGMAFKQKIESMVEVFSGLKEAQCKEQKRMMTAWSERDANINKGFAALAAMYGEMKVIALGAMPVVAQLEDETAGEGNVDKAAGV